MKGHGKQQRAHALLIPVAPEGHWAPMKTMLRQLVDHGISFTLFSSQDRISEVQGYYDSEDFKGLDRVELVRVFDPLVKGSTMVSVIKQMRDDFLNQPSIMQDLITQKSHGTGPTFLLSDMFLNWTQDIADELGIPRYSLFPSACAYATLFLLGTKVLDEGWYPQNPDQAKRQDLINLPGLEKYRGRDMPFSMIDSRETFVSYLEKLPLSAGFLLNGFEEMHVNEATALRNLLRTLATDGKITRLFFVGPLLQLPSFPRVKSEDESAATWKGSKCLQFLDSQPAKSVFYICFGSLWNISSSDMTELARGLEISGAPFLWVVRSPKDAPTSWSVSEVLPKGFESRTKRRGLVWTDWASQREILAHPSVGGFLSHCGWNSVLEAVCSGVPIMPWPLWADQAMNARLLATDFKVGVEMQATADGDMMGEEVAKAIKLLMASEEGEKMRVTMQELKRTAATAVLEGGSSYRGAQDFLQEVDSLCLV